MAIIINRGSHGDCLCLEQRRPRGSLLWAQPHFHVSQPAHVDPVTGPLYVNHWPLSLINKK